MVAMKFQAAGKGKKSMFQGFMTALYCKAFLCLWQADLSKKQLDF